MSICGDNLHSIKGPSCACGAVTDLRVSSRPVRGGCGEVVDAGCTGDDALHFESRFECGNLRKAIEVTVCSTCTCIYIHLLEVP